MELDTAYSTDELQLSRQRHGAAPPLGGNSLCVAPIAHPAQEYMSFVGGGHRRPCHSGVVVGAIVDPRRRRLDSGGRIASHGRIVLQMTLQVGVERESMPVEITDEVLGRAAAVRPARIEPDHK